MQDTTDTQIRKDLTAEIEALEKRYETLRNYLAGPELEDFEVVGILRAYRNDLSAVSAHLLTFYQLKKQKVKITWESLLFNIDTALDNIQNSAHPKPRASVELALNMSEPKIEEVMSYFSTLKKSL